MKGIPVVPSVGFRRAGGVRQATGKRGQDCPRYIRVRRVVEVQVREIATAAAPVTRGFSLCLNFQRTTSSPTGAAS